MGSGAIFKHCHILLRKIKKPGDFSPGFQTSQALLFDEAVVIVEQSISDRLQHPHHVGYEHLQPGAECAQAVVLSPC